MKVPNRVTVRTDVSKDQVTYESWRVWSRAIGGLFAFPPGNPECGPVRVTKTRETWRGLDVWHRAPEKSTRR